MRSWQLYVDDQIRSGTSPSTYASTDPTVSVLADEAPELRLKPPGRVVDLRWRSNPSLMSCLPRSIVNYREDDALGNRVEGWAVVTIKPASGGTGAGPADSGDRAALEEYQAEGLELLLKQIVVNEPLVVEGLPVYLVAHEFASQFKHPGYSVSVGDFTGNVGDVLEIGFAPEMTMFEFLTKLTNEFPDYIFYVDTAGALHFELA